MTPEAYDLFLEAIFALHPARRERYLTDHMYSDAVHRVWALLCLPPDSLIDAGDAARLAGPNLAAWKRYLAEVIENADPLVNVEAR